MLDKVCHTTQYSICCVKRRSKHIAYVLPKCNKKSNKEWQKVRKLEGLRGEE